MKILIWVLCTFVYAFVCVLFSNEGVVLGGWPSFFLSWVLLFAPAPLLSKLWDKRRAKEADETMEPVYKRPAPAAPEEPVRKEPKLKTGRWLRVACVVLFLCALFSVNAVVYYERANGSLERRNWELQEEVQALKEETEWSTDTKGRFRAQMEFEEALRRLFHAYEYGDEAWAVIEEALEEFS